MPTHGPPHAKDEYAESLYAPVSWWLLGFGFVLTIWWVFLLATPPPVPYIAAVAAGAATALLLWNYGRVRVRVRDGIVYAGNARLEIEYCGGATALDAAQTTALHGREADARAYLLLRPYIATGVRLQVDDERDPTPYWLISSRHPNRLAAAIEAARTPTQQVQQPTEASDVGDRMQD